MNQVNIIKNDNELSVNNVYRTINVIDNNRNGNTITVVQPITGIIQILTGPIGNKGSDGGSGSQGPSGSFPTSGSILFSGSIWINGYPVLTSNDTGSFVLVTQTSSMHVLSSSYAATSSQTLSSSYSLTASYALNGGTNINTSSFVLTSSFNQFTSSFNTGSFTGSFKGDGSQLSGINGSKWSGSSDISRLGNVSITGSLNISGSNTIRNHLRIGEGNPSTAKLSILGSNGGVGEGQIKLEDGSLLSIPEDGAIERNSDKLYFTIGTGIARKEFTLNDIALSANRIPFTTTNGRLTNSTNVTYDDTGILMSIGNLSLGKMNDASYGLQASGFHLGLFANNSACYMYLRTDGVIEHFDYNGTIFKSLVGTGSRMVESDNTGTIHATSEIVDANLIDSYIIACLTTGSNWSTGSYDAYIRRHKGGIILSSSFGGNPLTASVVFDKPFPSNNYAITVTGEDMRIWSLQSKTSGSVVINSNSPTPITGSTFYNANFISSSLEIIGNYYIGPSFTGSYQGQFYYDLNYKYFAVADNIIVRTPLV